jgi:hypothetical protein
VSWLRDFGEALIERYSSPESFRRGQGYYRRGAVASLVLRGQELYSHGPESVRELPELEEILSGPRST